MISGYSRCFYVTKFGIKKAFKEETDIEGL